MRPSFWYLLIVALLLSLLLGTSTASAQGIAEQVNTTLTQEQIAQRFADINSKYSIGQAFSDQDAAFVRTYATPANAGGVIPMAQKSFYKTNTSHAVKATFSGYVLNNINVTTFTYGGNVKCVITGGASNWKKTTLQITCTAYGLVGSGGVGIIYDGMISSSTTTSKTYTMNQTRKVSGLAAYTYTNANCIVGMKSGSYNI